MVPLPLLARFSLIFFFQGRGDQSCTDLRSLLNDCHVPDGSSLPWLFPFGPFAACASAAIIIDWMLVA